MLFPRVKLPDWSHVIDIDLAHAAMRLAIQPGSMFLKYLSQQKPLDGSFPSEVARLLGTSEKLRINGEQDEDEVRFFKSAYAEARTSYLFGEKSWFGLEENRIVAQRNLLKGNRPAYLDRIQCHPPAWATESVVPYRGSRRNTKIALEMERLATCDPHIAVAKAAAEKALIELRPVGHLKSLEALMDPKERNTRASDSKASQALERFLGIDQVHAEHMLQIMTHLHKTGVPMSMAKRYCLSFYRRVHHDALADLRQIERPNHIGPAGARALPRAVVNRVFCTDKTGRWMMIVSPRREPE